jgi:hypothetical protein
MTLSFDELVAAAAAKQRPYAGFFAWNDKTIAEHGVAKEFLLVAKDEVAIDPDTLRSRDLGMDPPDCEATTFVGDRIGIEITEVVDETAIQQSRTDPYVYAVYTKESFLARIQSILLRKDARVLLDPPYDEYWVLLHTDELMLTRETLAGWLDGFMPPQLSQTDRAYLLISYDPSIRACPYFRLL